MKTILSLTFITLFFIGCGGGSGSNNQTFTLECSSEGVYSPDNPPREFLPINDDKNITIILMHGKTGTPYSNNIQPYQEELPSHGYKVIFPYMPYSTSNWSGTLCEGMNYIDTLVESEKALGNNVIIAGHSMGGVHSLIYKTTNPDPIVKGFIVSAPGHMPDISNTMKNATKDSIDLANTLMNNNDTSINSFITINNGQSITITATAKSYLSYHDTEQWPPITEVVKEMSLPTIWFDGEDDPLMDWTKRNTVIDSISSSNFKYKILEGDHTTVIPNEIDEITSWIDGL